MNDPNNDPSKDAALAADEGPEAASAEGAAPSQLEDAERRAAENWDKYLRATAELENVRRRVEREAATLQKYAMERILADLITVNDSFELGMKAIAAESEETRKHLEGLALTHRQFWGTLERHGVSQVDPQGQAFNPELHEAVSMVESSEVPPNHVLTVMQKGYRLHDRVLRPAMVVVARAPATNGGEQGA
jgi:molecular chaperone GrpE